MPLSIPLALSKAAFAAIPQTSASTPTVEAAKSNRSGDSGTLVLMVNPKCLDRLLHYGKTWLLRDHDTRTREKIYIGRSDKNQIFGETRLVASRPISMATLMQPKSCAKHHIEDLSTVDLSKPLFVWWVVDTRIYTRPITFTRKMKAQTDWCHVNIHRLRADFDRIIDEDDDAALAQILATAYQIEADGALAESLKNGFDSGSELEILEKKQPHSDSELEILENNQPRVIDSGSDLEILNDDIDSGSDLEILNGDNVSVVPSVVNHSEFESDSGSDLEILLNVRPGDNEYWDDKCSDNDVETLRILQSLDNGSDSEFEILRPSVSR